MEINENLIKSYQLKIRKLNTKLLEKQKQLDEANDQMKNLLSEMEILKKQVGLNKRLENQYNHRDTWINKIAFIIATANKPLRSVDIIALLLMKEPVLEQKTSKEKFISAFLNIAVKYNRLIPFKLRGIRGNFYCLPQWMDQEGNPEIEMLAKIR
ncbi:hypothetical protein [Flavipsychrobacter stenotrophus]|nr:hypothetical protein [Flavipsychrobacter stenotrophus]